MADPADPADPTNPANPLLITGPSGSGKTRRTARLLDDWVQAHGPQGVVVLEFAPEHTQGNGQVLGRRLERFATIPDEALYVLVETKAPRATGEDEEAALRIAKDNEAACRQAWEEIPPAASALFVNDATMAFHVPGSDPAPLLQAIQESGFVVVNALDPQGFPQDHPVTKQEMQVLEELGQAVRRVERLGKPVPSPQERPRR